jgi:2-keto-4-pentenoate hydratase/2-oxohepta-3-ene-1,7-dioic acid hydratase in catechol pathway
MIGRFRFDDEIFTGTVNGDRVVVERGLYCDTYTLDELETLPPVNPSKIICVGLNYIDHARELEMELPGYPMIFLKPPSAIIGHGDMIVYPPVSQHVDSEAELAVVICKQCRNVPATYAYDVILGYTCFNDVTARDIQKADGQWTRAKSFDTFAPLGPFVVRAESVDISTAYIRSRVNGQLRQDSSVNNMIFDIPALIEFISHIMTLEKGDIIATGTPAGVGQLYPGDTVEIEIEGVGTLENEVVKP